VNRKISIKVCGLKFPDNREALEEMPVDFFGFIFYPESKRFVGKRPDSRLFHSRKNKVAVFVNESISQMRRVAGDFDFHMVQLHGKEAPETCRILKDAGMKVIKTFNLNEGFDFSRLEEYENHIDYFLFDTKTDLPGGSGKKFNWDILNSYSGKQPFFLSGGIGPEDLEKIRHLYHPNLGGIDLNSRFEDAPGVKNVELLRAFIEEVKR